MNKKYHKLTLQLPNKEMVKTLQGIAAELGYIQTRGGGAGQGSISQMVEAIAKRQVSIARNKTNE